MVQLSHAVLYQFSSVQSLGRVRLFVTPWTASHQASLSITNSWSLPKPVSIELVMPSNHLILRCPLLLLPSIFPSTRVFPNESVLCIRWLKYWSFSFSSRILEWVAYPFSRGSSWPRNLTGVSYIGVSAPDLPMNIQGCFPLGWTGWISLLSKGFSRVFSKPQFKSINSLTLSFPYSPTLTSVDDSWKDHSFN